MHCIDFFLLLVNSAIKDLEFDLELLDLDLDSSHVILADLDLDLKLVDLNLTWTWLLLDLIQICHNPNVTWSVLPPKAVSLFLCGPYATFPSNFVRIS